MFSVLRLIHVVGGSGWFGLAIGEAIIGAQVRKAGDAAGKKALASAWMRVGAALRGTLIVAIAFGIFTMLYEGLSRSGGMGEFMRDPDMIYIHVMLTLGLLAGILAVAAGSARSGAAAAVEAADEAAFAARYKRAAMFSGISNLLILLTIAEVYLRTAL